MSGVIPSLFHMPVLYLHRRVASIDHSRNANLCTSLYQMAGCEDRLLTQLPY
jgi:hypothetical protein